MKQLATLCFVLAFLTALQAQWLEGPAYPGGSTDGCYSFTIGNRLFIGGGLLPHKLYEYLPDNTWRELAEPPAGGERGWAFAFSIGDKGYVCGGANVGADNLMKDLWEYNTTTNTWTQKADMPAARDAGCAFAVGGKGYVCAGFDGGYLSDSFFEYDPVKDEWKTLNPFEGGMTIFPSAFVIEDKAYVVGGGSPTESRSLYRYNPNDDTWTSLADFPGDPRQAASAFTLNNQGYFGGGMQSYAVTFTDIWRYDPIEDEWAKTPEELPSSYTAWQVATGSGPSAIGEPQWAVFVAGAAFIDDQLLFSGRTFRYTPGQPLRVSENTALTDVVYPNPVERGTMLRLGDGAYRITDVVGRTVQEGTVTGEALSTARLPAGSYVLTRQMDRATTSTKLIVR